MPRAFRAALAVAAITSVVLLALALHTWVGQPLRIEWLFARMQMESLRADPERLAQHGGLLAVWERAERRLTDVSPAARSAAQARLQRSREALDGFDCGDYEGELRQSCEVLDYSLDMQLEAQRWQRYDHPVNPLFGLQNSLPAALLGTSPMASPRDVEHYLARLDAVPEKLDGLLQDLVQRRAEGILPPRAMLPRVLDDLRRFVQPKAVDSPLVKVLSERLSLVAAAQMPPPVKARFIERAEATVARSVYPAWRRLIDHFEALQALPLTDSGAWAQPEGADYYAFMVRWHTSTSFTPAAIHQLGIDDVARLSAELAPKLAALGLVQGSIGQRLQALAQRPEQRFGSGEAARQAVLAAFRGHIERAAHASAPAFTQLPSAPMLVDAVPPARERSAPGAYYSPPMRAGQPGMLYLNLRDLDDLPRFSLRTLAHHEATPGHHLQSAWLLQQTELPAFRQQLSFSAYAEGWAMYAEQLAGELGLLPAPEDDIGRLQSELFRAARLVVDTGLHQQRWSVAQAVHYLRDSAGLGGVEARAEVERYLIFPGQALSFQIGLQRFRALRARAETELGVDFDLPAFHAMLLDGGRLPLDLLDIRVDRWIAVQRSTKPIQ